jgi:hypothetical protein
VLEPDHWSISLTLLIVSTVAPGFMATSPDYERQWNNWPAAFRDNLEQAGFLDDAQRVRRSPPREDVQ